MSKFAVIQRGHAGIVLPFYKGYELKDPQEDQAYPVTLAKPTVSLTGPGYTGFTTSLYGRAMYNTLEEAEAECERRLQAYIRQCLRGFEDEAQVYHEFCLNYLDGKLKRV